MSETRKFGLIGYPLSHSFSAKYFKEKFIKEEILDASYENFPIENITLFKELVNKVKPIGLNVTIPYKEQVIKYLTNLDPVAKEVGAVNTIKFIDGELIGFNTDVYGFQRSLAPFLASNHQRGLILGTGGASKAVAYALKKLGLDIMFVSRSPKNDKELGYNQLNKEVLKAFQLIVNTTPLGTYPNTEAYPEIPYGFITPDHLLYDLVYNPPLTQFLAKGKEKGAIVVNGENMLKLQAERAWEIWNLP